MKGQISQSIVLIVPHRQRCSPVRSTWVVRSRWKREVSGVDPVAHQGEGIAPMAFTEQAIDTVWMSNL